jgi:hypothetical protein
MLEITESKGALVKIFGRFGGVQAETLGVIVHSPEFSVFIPVVIFTSERGNEVQHPAGIIGALEDVIGNGTGVGHDLYGIFENIFIDSLQNINISCICSEQESMVDMSVAIGNTADRFAGDSKGVSGFFNLHDFTSKNNSALAENQQKTLFSSIT